MQDQWYLGGERQQKLRPNKAKWTPSVQRGIFMHLKLPIHMSTQALDKDVFCYTVIPSEEKHMGELLKLVMLEVMAA